MSRSQECCGEQEGSVEKIESSLQVLLDAGFAVMFVADEAIKPPQAKGVVVLRESAAPFALRQAAKITEEF